MNRELKKYYFHWDLMDVLVSGKSLLDSDIGLQGFPLASVDEADRFLLSYGYDHANPIEQAEILGNFREAISFIRKYFLFPENPEGLKLEIPRVILEAQDVRQLLLITGQAATPDNKQVRDWACACLKVMHAIAHIDKDVRTTYFADIQKQIFDRFYRFIHRTTATASGATQLYMGENEADPMKVQLDAFETKPKKSRESLLLKLLHKPENVADEVFDRVGVRFITKNRFDVIRVLKYLKDQMIVMPANIKPSRSRNTLIDIPLLKEDHAFLMEKYRKGELEEPELLDRLEASIQSPKADLENPHTSRHYRSIQFTGRHLIKIRNPIYMKVRDLKQMKDLPDAMSKVVADLDLKYVQPEIRFFYPYEVQVVDRVSHDNNEQGRSSHSDYKNSQILTALKRVMGDLA